MKVVEISDVGRGLNTKRSGLRKLFTLVQKVKISDIHLTYLDRLTRFGFEYLQSYFDSYGVSIYTLNKKEE
jgi:predicted site-specific integrase-resolvase